MIFTKKYGIQLKKAAYEPEFHLGSFDTSTPTKINEPDQIIDLNYYYNDDDYMNIINCILDDDS